MLAKGRSLPSSQEAVAVFSEGKTVACFYTDFRATAWVPKAASAIPCKFLVLCVSVSSVQNEDNSTSLTGLLQALSELLWYV